MGGLSWGREGKVSVRVAWLMFLVLGGAYESASGRWLGVEGVCWLKALLPSVTHSLTDEKLLYGQIYAVL